jgi:hypothetical protein
VASYVNRVGQQREQRRVGVRPSGQNLGGILWTAVSPTATFGYLTGWTVLALAGLIGAHRR